MNNKNYTNYVDEILCNLNKNFNNLTQKQTNITQKYNNISLHFPKLLNNNIIQYEKINDLEISLNELDVSLNDLDIQLQTFLYIIEQVNNMEKVNNINETNDLDSIDETNKNIQKQYEEIKQTDKLIDTTINKMLPLFMLCLMMIDKNSILNSNRFGKNNNNNKDNLDGKPMIHTMENNEDNKNNENDEDNKNNEDNTEDNNLKKYIFNNIDLD